MHLGKNEASALSRLFSAAVLRDFGKHARSPLFSRLLDHTRLALDVPSEATVGTAFDKAFKLLSKSRFRDDYVYRAAITEKILLGRHSINTATLLNEVRAGSSKADVVVLNGTATAYEIKSDIDSLARLKSQIANYRHVFARVNVVASKSHLSAVLNSTPEDVGVITLSERFSFQTARVAQNCPERIKPTMILEMLRIDEATAILTHLGREVPAVPNTQIRSELVDMFAELDPTAVHEEMVRVLRASRSQANLAKFINSIPVSIRAASLAVKPNPKSRSRIQEAVDTPLDVALAWK